jgi:DNA ligase (NAD+)
LHGLGIPQVGVQTAKLLAKHWPSMHLLIDATIEELCICETIGETIATSIVSFFQDISNRRLISKLSQLGISMGNDGTASNGNETLPLSGQVFAITGSFRSYSREELREAIERRGGMVRSAISKNVHTLLMGANGGSKVHEAQRLGIPIIPESELHSLLGG